MKPSYTRQAASIRAAAKRWLKEGKEHFEDETDMVDVYREDVVELNEIADLLDSGNLRKAQTKANDLDTVVREQIPEKVWDQLFAGD